MATIAANTSAQVALTAGNFIQGTGAGVAQVGSGARGADPLTAGDPWQIGPFERDETIHITAYSAIAYEAEQPLSLPSPADRLSAAEVAAIQASVSGGGVGIGRKFAILGDSISANNTPSTWGLRSDGYMTWARILSGGKVDFDSSLNFGVSGDTSMMALARVQSVINAAPDACVVLVGTNDPFNSVPFGDESTVGSTVYSCATIYRTLRAAGIAVVMVPVLPRAKDSGAGGITSANRAKLLRIYRWQVTFAARNKWITLADPTQQWVDYTTGNGDPWGGLGSATAWTTDGLHASQRGGYWVGSAVSDAVSSMIANWDGVKTPGEAYDATNNPAGNLVANPMMTGTGGTASTGFTGSIASSWTAQRQGGTTGAGVGSKVTKTLSNGKTYDQQQWVLTAPSGASTEEFQLRQTIAAGITFGTDSVYAECEIEVSSITAGSLVGVDLRLSDGTKIVYACRYDQGVGYAVDTAFSGIFRTPVFTPGSGATFVQPQVMVRIDGTVASAGATVKVSRVGVYKTQP